MINIAICDDDKSICAQIENIILQYQKYTQKKIDVQVYFDGESLLEEIQKNGNIDLIFLDIQLSNKNGVDVGNTIRKNLNNQQVQIIYISGYDKYAMDLFQVRPLNFLLKPISKEDIISNIELFYSLLNKEKNYYSYKSGFNVKRVNFNTLIYFESNNRKITIHTTEGTDSFYGKLDDIYEELKESNFLYIHKSYLVNPVFVKVYQYESLILENDSVLPISQTKRKEIREKILRNMI